MHRVHAGRFSSHFTFRALSSLATRILGSEKYVLASEASSLRFRSRATIDRILGSFRCHRVGSIIARHQHDIEKGSLSILTDLQAASIRRWFQPIAKMTQRWLSKRTLECFRTHSSGSLCSNWCVRSRPFHCRRTHSIRRYRVEGRERSLQ